MLDQVTLGYCWYSVFPAHCLLTEGVGEWFHFKRKRNASVNRQRGCGNNITLAHHTRFVQEHAKLGTVLLPSNNSNNGSKTHIAS